MCISHVGVVTIEHREVHQIRSSLLETPIKPQAIDFHASASHQKPFYCFPVRVQFKSGSAFGFLSSLLCSSDLMMECMVGWLVAGRIRQGRWARMCLRTNTGMRRERFYIIQGTLCAVSVPLPHSLLLGIILCYRRVLALGVRNLELQ